MAEHRTRKNKENKHYGFLYSWQPKDSSQARVKGELDSTKKSVSLGHAYPKRANLLAKDDDQARIKKDIIKSVILVSLILIAEVVVYLAWKRYMP